MQIVSEQQSTCPFYGLNVLYGNKNYWFYDVIWRHQNTVCHKQQVCDPCIVLYCGLSKKPQGPQENKLNAKTGKRNTKRKVSADDATCQQSDNRRRRWAGCSRVWNRPHGMFDSRTPHSRYLQSMCQRWSEPMSARHVGDAIRSSARHCGANPCNDLKINIASLNCMRSDAHIQWRLASVSVIWSERRRPAKDRAAALSTDWMWRYREAGIPIRMAWWWRWSALPTKKCNNFRGRGCRWSSTFPIFDICSPKRTLK